MLGVSQKTDRRGLKRAYAALIRVYEPEHHPDHFRRLREAFELLDKRLSWMEANSATSQEALEPSAVAADGAAGGGRRRQAAAAECAAHQMPAELEVPWHAACRGDLAAAYASHAQLARQDRADELLYARLHWLLRIDRQLDPDRDPRDWLVAGMKRCGLVGRLTELYRCELIEDPYEALRDRCDEALSCSRQSGLLAQLVLARWFAAAKLRKWAVISRH